MDKMLRSRGPRLLSPHPMHLNHYRRSVLQQEDCQDPWVDGVSFTILYLLLI